MRTLHHGMQIRWTEYSEDHGWGAFDRLDPPIRLIPEGRNALDGSIRNKRVYTLRRR